ncbi:transcriptional regulator, LuxR family [Paenibacillus curdlanolyticus YK9]|uniref:Transcriptional regulator, LuxR family n=1 Tax=Paenibacillus curdlanolyticus YK9 TaxID=717606 RepID=E0I6D1_9BACL|nr:LuxR C-terminal-related transcriptional regulator [Paenibacillus curdlanolyticus]EFM11597.1 transcriptional regulator, LuxR family [Paenibacillus curdlanolyticus YK9]
MKSLFNDLNTDNKRFWIEVDDLDWSVLSQLNQCYRTANNGGGTDKRPTALSAAVAEQFQSITAVFRQMMEPLSRSLLMPHLFLLLTPDAQVIDYEGTSNVIDNLHVLGIHKGCSLDVNTAGINAASLCQQTNKLSVVKGNEHTLHKFCNNYGLCAPIYNQDTIVAMLGLTFDLLYQTNFAIPVLVQAIQGIEQHLKPNAMMEQQKVFSEFDQYKLTPREKQIGYEWLENKTVQYISAKHKISELTVRTFIKRIYNKVNVCSKGDFIRRFYLHS